MSGVCAVPRAPRTWLPPALAVLALLLAAFALPWNLEALTSAHGFADALDRLLAFVRAFAAPDLSAAMLAKCAALAGETLAVAGLGTALGLAASYPLALGACRAIVLGNDPLPRGEGAARRLLLETCRLALDTLRGVPDFAWAIVIANVTGVSPVTGVLAIAVSVAGIYGKVLSEQWDNVDPQRYAALRATGAGTLATFAYGVQPLAGRAMLSFVLMRTECAVRNASVIGVVGGGGLGAALWDHYTDGDWPGFTTVLLALLAVTAGTDLLANLLRARLRIDPNHPRAARPVDRLTARRRRRQVLGSVLLLLGAAIAMLREPIARAFGELQRIEWDFVRPYTLGLFAPDLSGTTLLAALRASAVPLALGVLATLAGTVLATLLAFPASIAFQLEAHRFTGERLPPFHRALRWASVVAARGLALLLRGIPEVAWVVLFAQFFRLGATPAVFAIAVHSAGVLHRVFTETLDNLPYRHLERLGAPGRLQTFVYGALPRALPDWRTYAFFQFEVNVRTGVALGMVGAGGLGHLFQLNLEWRQHGNAATFLWAMVALTVAIDRTSRWLQLRRLRC